MSSTRSVPMTDGTPRSRHRTFPGRPAAWVSGVAMALAVIALIALLATASTSTPTAAESAEPAPTMATTPATDHPTTPTMGTAAEPSDLYTVEVTSVTLPARPPNLGLDAEALAARFVAEWLTYPPGPEPAPALADRVGDLATPAYRAVIEGLSTAGTEERPGSVASMGAVTPLDPSDAAVVVYRVTAWQARYGPADDVTGPDSWDVTLVPDPAGGWRVDGLRRAG